MKNLILAAAMVITVASGVAIADTGQGTHTPGTIAAIGNNGTSIGGGGRDVLIGGTGADYLDTALQLLVVSVDYLIKA